MRAFVDTSSLFKKYVEEGGSKELDELLQDVSEIAVSPTTWVEANAVIARRLREGSLSFRQAVWLRSQMGREFEGFHRVIWNETLEATAVELVHRRPVSTLDAIQLASAVLSKAHLLVTSDHRLFKEAGRQIRKVRLIE